MSRKANPAIVGAFILGALVLSVVAVALLASGALFSGHDTFVTYFSEPVNGLSVGAPVKYRGIQLGEVTRIRLYQRNPDANAVAEVRYELEHSRIENLGGSRDMISSGAVEELVRDYGLRARLEVESIVTGVVFVTVEFKEDAGPPDLLNPGSDVVEIPSTPSPLSELTESAGEVIARLSTIDVKRISENLLDLTETVRDRIDEVRLGELAENVTEIAERLNELLSDPELDQIDTSLITTLREFSETNQAIQDRLTNVEPTLEKFDRIADQLNEMAVSLTAATRETNNMLQQDAEFRRSLEQTLAEASMTMKSLRRFLNMLEKNPNVIIAGKPEGRK